MSDLRNHIFSSIYKKAERLASATFMVSDIMPEGNELKTNIRHLSIELVSKSVSSNPNALEPLVLNIMSLLEISFISGLISEMNARILKEEFNGFLGLIDRQSSSLSASVTSLFSEDSPAKEEKITQKTPLLKMPQMPREPKASRKETRGKNILEFIAQEGSVSIKDISQNIRGCSEKTIQRELAKMINSGAVKKMGERRWTRYEVA